MGHEGIVGLADLDSPLAHGGQVRPPRDQRDVDPGPGHPRAQEGPGGAGPDYHNLHGTIFIALTS